MKLSIKPSSILYKIRNQINLIHNILFIILIRLKKKLLNLDKNILILVLKTRSNFWPFFEEPSTLQVQP